MELVCTGSEIWTVQNEYDFCLFQSIIRDNPDSNEGKTSAAIEIQRTWRGYLLRWKLRLFYLQSTFVILRQKTYVLFQTKIVHMIHLAF